MTLLARLQFYNRRFPNGWYTFRHVKSSGHLLDVLKRVYGDNVKVTTIVTASEKG